MERANAILISSESDSVKRGQDLAISTFATDLKGQLFSRRAQKYELLIISSFFLYLLKHPIL